MKNLKSFNESTNNNFFRIISEDEFFEMVDRAVSLSEKAIQLIESHDIGGYFEPDSSNILRYKLPFKGVISELQDEWFLINKRHIVYFRYYLCDQLEGLDKFLSEIDIKKK